jgi:hypothetical protein
MQIGDDQALTPETARARAAGAASRANTLLALIAARPRPAIRGS